MTVVSGFVGFVSAALAVFVMQYGGLLPEPVDSASEPAGDADGHIQGDVNCDEQVTTFDVLAVLVHEADVGDLPQEEPCPDIGTASIDSHRP